MGKSSARSRASRKGALAGSVLSTDRVRLFWSATNLRVSSESGSSSQR